MMNGVLNAGYPGYPSFNPTQAQSLPQQQMPQMPQMPVSHPMRQQQQMPPVPQPNSYSGGQPSRVSRPLMSSSPLSDPGGDQVASVPGGDHVTGGDQDDNTRMQMRQQRDVANAAGIKCSQF